METNPFIGRRVKVIVDRPLGSTDPEMGYVYPVNCGRVPDEHPETQSDLPAYVLGLCDPIKFFEGDCIAAIKHKDSDGHHLVIVPSGASLSDEAIRESLHFHSSLIDSHIIRR